MTDILLSLIIIAVCGMLAALFFILSRRKNLKREEDLANYCAARAYILTRENQPLVKKLVISYGDWNLIAEKQAIVNDSASGSSAWRREMNWFSNKENELRPSFALHCASSVSGWEKLPGWLQAAATQKIMDGMGCAATNMLHPRIVRGRENRAYLLFEPEESSAQAAVEKLIPLLDEWDVKLPLYVVCSERGVRLRVPDGFIERVKEIDMVIRIGLAAE